LEALTYVVLVLLSLVGYSGGATSQAGKNTDLKPVILDLILAVLIWAAAIYCQLTCDFNKWLMILAWIGISAVLGIVTEFFRRLQRRNESKQQQIENLTSALFKRLWHRWVDLSRRMCSFQSRIMLSLFFFILISPAAMMIKVLKDPLQIKKKKVMGSYWSIRTQKSEEFEHYRRQF
jgi:hypothetical protein